MLIEVDEDWFDDSGNSLYDDLIILDWKEFSTETCQTFVDALEVHGLDLVLFDSHNDSYVMRIMKKATKKKK